MTSPQQDNPYTSTTDDLPNPKTVTKIVPQSTGIGRCLAGALEQVMNDDSDNPTTQNGPSSYSHSVEDNQCMLDAFGMAVAQQVTATPAANKTTSSSSSSLVCRLQGRLDSYNRMDEHWLLTADQVTIARHDHVDDATAPARKRRRKKYHWTKQDPNARAKVWKTIPGKIKFLAYNDAS